MSDEILALYSPIMRGLPPQPELKRTVHQTVFPIYEEPSPPELKRTVHQTSFPSYEDLLESLRHGFEPSPPERKNYGVVPPLACPMPDGSVRFITSDRFVYRSSPTPSATSVPDGLSPPPLERCSHADENDLHFVVSPFDPPKDFFPEYTLKQYIQEMSLRNTPPPMLKRVRSAPVFGRQKTMPY